MLRKSLLLNCASLLVTLAIASTAQAWGCYHYSYHRSYGGGYHYSTGYHYGYGGGGGSRYGYVRRW